ncbi:unnamed protein product [Amoebophrya sp. A120]|nr:unnamed protein product [Amoebophrya sp. A120]|eukprot:GSA120T00010216001.1
MISLRQWWDADPTDDLMDPYDRYPSGHDDFAAFAEINHDRNRNTAAATGNGSTGGNGPAGRGRGGQQGRANGRANNSDSEDCSQSEDWVPNLSQEELANLEILPEDKLAEFRKTSEALLRDIAQGQGGQGVEFLQQGGPLLEVPSTSSSSSSSRGVPDPQPYLFTQDSSVYPPLDNIYNDEGEIVIKYLQNKQRRKSEVKSTIAQDSEVWSASRIGQQRTEDGPPTGTGAAGRTSAVIGNNAQEQQEVKNTTSPVLSSSSASASSAAALVPQPQRPTQSSEEKQDESANETNQITTFAKKKRPSLSPPLEDPFVAGTEQKLAKQSYSGRLGAGRKSKGVFSARTPIPVKTGTINPYTPESSSSDNSVSVNEKKQDAGSANLKSSPIKTSPALKLHALSTSPNVVNKNSTRAGGGGGINSNANHSGTTTSSNNARGGTPGTAGRSNSQVLRLQQ